MRGVEKVFTTREDKGRKGIARKIRNLKNFRLVRTLALPKHQIKGNSHKAIVISTPPQYTGLTGIRKMWDCLSSNI